ncbi:hypothetical protein GGX14DRAFT_405518 [Mycena pura]|uniref:Uncharacterized protein n=1 Tax=Mycena pura TaxID=153505 RepID=A0AAD6US51_9AGAR|nr:hypothetical protein GGX14DRAFT_405518 [Mycena pura]
MQSSKGQQCRTTMTFKLKKSETDAADERPDFEFEAFAYLISAERILKRIFCCRFSRGIERWRAAATWARDSVWSKPVQLRPGEPAPWLKRLASSHQEICRSLIRPHDADQLHVRHRFELDQDFRSFGSIVVRVDPRWWMLVDAGALLSANPDAAQDAIVCRDPQGRGVREGTAASAGSGQGSTGVGAGSAITGKPTPRARSCSAAAALTHVGGAVGAVGCVESQRFLRARLQLRRLRGAGTRHGEARGARKERQSVGVDVARALAVVLGGGMGAGRERAVHVNRWQLIRRLF